MTFQPSLFDADTVADDRVAVRFAPDFDAWQPRARALLHEGVAPERVWWQPDGDTTASGVDRAHADRASRSDSRSNAGRKVPRAFLARARAASCHRDPDRWALLYSMLWRLTHDEPHLLRLVGDPQTQRLDRMVKAVHRDVHKMKAFVRFRAVEEPGFDEPRYVAWFEPSHDIVAYAAGFFVRRFANMRWSILTPVGCVHWDGSGEPWFSPPADRADAPAGDALEDAWRVYYASIFNPARIKLDAMRSEMPQKYWKNLPEAQLIPGLVRDADRRVAAMEAARKQEDALRCGPRPDAPSVSHAAAVADAAPRSLQRLALQAQTCRACPLGDCATQTVFGQGPADARIMIVGEQPGDREDLAGRPFVGPAGQLLDRALAEAGVDREACYLTNAVKHFKFRARGKTRLHATPGEAEIAACKPWLDAEIGLVDPAMVICLGATAGRSVIGPETRVMRDRGRPIDLGSRQATLTVHPSYLLRQDAARPEAAAFRRFVEELAAAGAVA